MPETRTESGLMTFAFWCRKAHVGVMKQRYLAGCGFEGLRLGRGLVFHIASTNMPLNFGYTLVTGLLAGNANIIKLAQREFTQTTMLLNSMVRVLSDRKFALIRDYINIVRYDSAHSELTDTFSTVCDARVVWGGDETVREIRKSPLPPQAFELCFVDRYSLCVIDTDALQEHSDFRSLAQDLYNDAYLFDQNAFTAPHLMIWMGEPEHRSKIKESIWMALQAKVDVKYTVDSAVVADKLAVVCREAIDYGGIQRIMKENNKLVRVEMKQFHGEITAYKGLGGLFHEYDITSLVDILPLVDKRIQTLAYHGISHQTLVDFVFAHRLKGIDRIVPVGRTADFDLVWDGFDLMGILSRLIL